MTQNARAQLLALSPPGSAFPREPGSNWARALAPIGDEHGRLEEEAEALLREVDPRDAPRLLADYERVLGEDPCIGPPALLPLEVRRALAHQRWTTRGGATRQFFLDLAAALGLTVSIQEYRPLAAGFRAGAPAADANWIHAWRVHVTGAASALLECAIRRRAPAHTIVVFTSG